MIAKSVACVRFTNFEIDRGWLQLTDLDTKKTLSVPWLAWRSKPNTYVKDNIEIVLWAAVQEPNCFERLNKTNIEILTRMNNMKAKGGEAIRGFVGLIGRFYINGIKMIRKFFIIIVL